MQVVNLYVIKMERMCLILYVYGSPPKFGWVYFHFLVDWKVQYIYNIFIQS
jgi:hypothetical protein